MTASGTSPENGQSPDGASCGNEELLKTARRAHIRAQTDHLGDQLIALHRKVDDLDDEQVHQELREFLGHLALLVELAEKNVDEEEVPE